MYLLPVPQFLEYNQQEFFITYYTKIMVDSALGFQEYGYAKILQNHINENLFFKLTILKVDQTEENSIYLDIDHAIKEEENRIMIQTNMIRVTGGSSEALLQAVQTLRQMITQCGSVLPGLKIIDYPQIKYRGYYFDVTRGRIPTLENLKALADKLSYYKLNQLQLYVEHSFLFKNFSEVWRDDTPLTSQEIIELDEYCKNLNIALVPSVASFGHLHKLLSTKTYSELCELEVSNKEPFSYMSRMQHHTVNVTNEKSFEMIRATLLEFMPLFSTNLFNICADETFDLGKGKSKEMAADIGTQQLYTNFLKRLCKILIDQGKQPMFWGDIILANPELIKELPENVICLNWDYNTNGSDINLKQLFDLGVSQYVCPGVHGWRRLLNHYKNAYDNISRMVQYAHQYKVEGVLNTDWGDYGHINHPEFSTAGMIYGAAFAWNSKFLEFSEINKQISTIEYRDDSGEFISIINRIGSQDCFIWEHAVQLKESMQKNLFDNMLNDLLKDLEEVSFDEANDKIEQAVNDLYRMLPHMDMKRREIVKPYLVAAKGMQIFNQIGKVMTQFVLNTIIPKEIDCKKLAVELEYWFMDYKDKWREQYKESELYRIMEVIVWYADYLREI